MMVVSEERGEDVARRQRHPPPRAGRGRPAAAPGAAAGARRAAAMAALFSRRRRRGPPAERRSGRTPCSDLTSASCSRWPWPRRSSSSSAASGGSYVLTVPVAAKLPDGPRARRRRCPRAAGVRRPARGRACGPRCRRPRARHHRSLPRPGTALASWFVRPESLRLPAGVRVESLYPSQGTSSCSGKTLERAAISRVRFVPDEHHHRPSPRTDRESARPACRAPAHRGAAAAGVPAAVRHRRRPRRRERPPDDGRGGDAARPRARVPRPQRPAPAPGRHRQGHAGSPATCSSRRSPRASARWASTWCSAGPLPTPGIANLTDLDARRRRRRDLAPATTRTRTTASSSSGATASSCRTRPRREIEELVASGAEIDAPSRAHRDRHRQGLRASTTRAAATSSSCKTTFPRELTLDGLTIVVDCANGAAYKVGARGARGARRQGDRARRQAGRQEHQRQVRRAAPRGAGAARCVKHGAHLGHRARRRRRPRSSSCDEKGKVVDGDAIMAICAARARRAQGSWRRRRWSPR